MKTVAVRAEGHFQTTSVLLHIKRRLKNQADTSKEIAVMLMVLEIIFFLIFGRLQSSGTLDRPDRLYPVWAWAVVAAAIYALGAGAAGYFFYGTFSTGGMVMLFVLIFAWLTFYFKQLRATTDNAVLHQVIYWGMGIASTTIPLVFNTLLKVTGYMEN